MGFIFAVLVVIAAFWLLYAMVDVMLEAFGIIFFPVKVTWSLLAGLYGWLKWGHGKFKSWGRKPVYGQAAWASQAELKKQGHFELGGYVFGKQKRRPLVSNPEASMIMQARPGFGKSSTLGATLSRVQGEHLVVYDPPGGLLKRFEADLASKGYRIIKLDLDEPLNGSAYDPFAFFRDSQRYSFERDMDTLARLVVVDGVISMGADKHFTEISEGMVGALAGYFQQFEPEKATLAEVSRVITAAGKVEMDDLLSKVALCPSDYCRKGINAYHRAEVRERASMDTTNSRKVKSWTTATYTDLCRKTADAWAWEDVWTSAQPVAVFITGGVGEPQNMSAFLRVFFGQCAASLARQYNRMRKPIPNGVKIMVDEAALLGRCEPIVNAVTELRKAGVSVFLCYQSLSQLRELYGDKAENLLDNCDLIITGGGQNLKDYEMVSKLIGKRTDWAMQKNKGGSNQSETGIYVIAPDELRRLPKGEHVALVGSLAVRCEAPWKIRNGAVVY